MSNPQPIIHHIDGFTIVESPITLDPNTFTPHKKIEIIWKVTSTSNIPLTEDKLKLLLNTLKELCLN